LRRRLRSSRIRGWRQSVDRRCAQNLPRLRRILSRGCLAGRMETQPNYLAVLRLATAKPNHQDRPGQLASIQRRARAGEAVGGDQKAGGF
jgi:hypothetical protein